MREDSHGRVQDSWCSLCLPPPQCRVWSPWATLQATDADFGTPGAGPESPRQSLGPPRLVQTPVPEPHMPHLDYQHILHDPPRLHSEPPSSVQEPPTPPPGSRSYRLQDPRGTGQMPPRKCPGIPRAALTPPKQYMGSLGAFGTCKAEFGNPWNELGLPR